MEEAPAPQEEALPIDIESAEQTFGKGAHQKRLMVTPMVSLNDLMS